MGSPWSARLFGDDVDSYFDRFLEPSVIYSTGVLSAVAGGGVHAAAHITGGGLVGNLVRVLPAGLGAKVDTGAWEVPQVFETVESRGVSQAEMWSTFNMGIGFCLVVAPEAVESVLSSASAHDGRVIGRIITGDGVALG